ncbi:hypothetical protein [Chromatocurvus halotolerans]|uniref:Uncharacterized protein n=1 Tax=Chromatocurvus halotolerans TaxID=1132028 RepID=A0A4R2KVE2_9GAMM|nr:hypothetical protein [Chromatocurvus halotolerans]TCO78461.1 hypothetical protein EV688_101278 [Chromatocurvus halotolerans]
MRQLVSILTLTALATGHTQAGFLDDLLKTAKDAAKETAEDTAKDLVAETTEQLIRGMFVGYTSRQTRSDTEVAREFEKDHGDLPVNAQVSSYRTEIQPGASVRPGTEVRVRSWIEVTPGRSGDRPVIEERLTIWDNEDNSIALKGMTKAAAERAGAFRGEFTFTLPEGLPQGVYPVSTSLMLNGEPVGDQKHGLQLVLRVAPAGNLTLVALNAGTSPIP